MTENQRKRFRMNGIAVALLSIIPVLGFGIAGQRAADATVFSTTPSTIVATTGTQAHKAKCIGKFSSDNTNDIGVIEGGTGFYLYRGGNGENYGTAHKIASFTNYSEEAYVADVDGDGWNDIVIGGLDFNTFWLKNRGSNQYSTTWAKYNISTSVDSHDCIPADVDHDGKVDIVVCGGVLFRNGDPTLGTGSWEFHSCNRSGGQGTTVVNMYGNNDGYMDIIGAQFNTGSSPHTYSLCWMENPGHTGGNSRTGTWTKHVIDSNPGGVSQYNEVTAFDSLSSAEMSTATGDFNKDGRPDIAFVYMYSYAPGTNEVSSGTAGSLTHAGDGLVWYECPANPQGTTSAWASGNKHVIMPGLCWVHEDSLKVADYNGDGNLDIGFAEQEQSLWRNDGAQSGGNGRVGFVYGPGTTGSWSSPEIVASSLGGIAGGHNNKIGNVSTDTRPSMITANHSYWLNIINHTTESSLRLYRNISTGTNHVWPYVNGNEMTIPSKIEAENFDNGGEGVAYHDADTTNNGSMYRREGVDIEHTSDTSGAYDVGWNNSGEWLGYTVNVASAGTYYISPRVSSTGAGSFHFEFGPVGQIGGAGVTSTSTFTVSSTGWTDLSPISVSLSAGVQWMRLVDDSGTGVYNLNYFNITNGPAAPTLTSATPGNAQVALAWSTVSGATYNVYRSTSSGTETLFTSGVGTTTFNNTGLTNGTTYYYKVASVVGGVTSGLSNELSATPSAGVTGTLTGGVTVLSTGTNSYNLTTLTAGSSNDWKAWARGTGSGHDTVVDFKATGGSQIGTANHYGMGGTWGTWNDTPYTRSWTDGETGAVTISNDDGYLWQNAASGNQGWTFTVPSSSTTRTLYVLCGGNHAVSSINAHLGGTTATDYNDSKSSTGIFANLYSFTYSSASAATLTITFNKTGNVTGQPTDGSANLSSAWLVTSTGGGGTNLITNPGFESNTASTFLSPWVGSGPDYYGVDVNIGQARSGLNEGWIYANGSTSGNWNQMAQPVTVTASTTLTLSAYVRGSGPIAANAAKIGILYSDGTRSETAFTPAASYTQQSVTFSTGAHTSGTIYLGYTTPTGGAGNYIQADDFSLAP